MEREDELVYAGDQPDLLRGFDRDPGHWRAEHTGDYVALGGLTSLVGELHQNVETLRPNAVEG